MQSSEFLNTKDTYETPKGRLSEGSLDSGNPRVHPFLVDCVVASTDSSTEFCHTVEKLRMSHIQRMRERRIN